MIKLKVNHLHFENILFKVEVYQKNMVPFVIVFFKLSKRKISYNKTNRIQYLIFFITSTLEDTIHIRQFCFVTVEQLTLAVSRSLFFILVRTAHLACCTVGFIALPTQAVVRPVFGAPRSWTEKGKVTIELQTSAVERPLSQNCLPRQFYRQFTSNPENVSVKLLT